MNPIDWSGFALGATGDGFDSPVCRGDGEDYHEIGLCEVISTIGTEFKQYKSTCDVSTTLTGKNLAEFVSATEKGLMTLKCARLTRQPKS